MSRRRVSPGLKKGQNLMQKAAAAYRAGKYPTMQDALRGVARGGKRRRNPDDDVLFPYADRFSSETYPSLATPDYSVMQVSARGSTARAPSQVDGNLVFDAFFGEGMFGDFLTNPRGRRPATSRARTKAQNNAAKAMRLFHSGKAASLADAWAMVRRSR